LFPLALKLFRESSPLTPFKKWVNYLERLLKSPFLKGDLGAMLFSRPLTYKVDLGFSYDDFGQISQKESFPCPTAYFTMDLASATTNISAAVTTRAPFIPTFAKIASPCTARNVVLIKSGVKGWSCDGSARRLSASSRCGYGWRSNGFCVWCAGRCVQVRVYFAPERRSYTHAFERCVLELARHYDHQGCVPVPEHGLGCDQGHSEKKSHQAICQT